MSISITNTVNLTADEIRLEILQRCDGNIKAAKEAEKFVFGTGDDAPLTTLEVEISGSVLNDKFRARKEFHDGKVKDYASKIIAFKDVDRAENTSVDPLEELKNRQKFHFQRVRYFDLLFASTQSHRLYRLSEARLRELELLE